MGRSISLLLVEDSEDDELLLLMCLRKGFDVPFIIVSGSIGEEAAVGDPTAAARSGCGHRHR